MDQSTIKKLLEQQLISPKAKLEAFLATSLKLRTASQVTIPAELPSGLEMGKKIDQAVQPHMIKLQKIKDIRQRASAVSKLKKLLERHFEEIVEGSDEYKAYYKWAKNNGLRVNQIKVRPTVHEMYFYTDRGTGRKINKLMREREKIRRKVQRKPGENINSIRFAYPEEFEPKWLKHLGHILGYPDCCVEQYADDRKNEVNVEARAAQQLIDALKEEDVDTHVYYTGYFFPCTPRCEKALETGYQWHEAFKELGMNLGSMYEQNIYVNTELVLKQPELIQRYLSQFKPKTSY
ncbi:DUF483 domain-containing protein [Candidatus Bathyarchaeota archaeon]|nr:DUF483 domain-containing protein [Candidatus Bathyarchaeota archaeon]